MGISQLQSRYIGSASFGGQAPLPLHLWPHAHTALDPPTPLPRPHPAPSPQVRGSYTTEWPNLIDYKIMQRNCELATSGRIDSVWC